MTATTHTYPNLPEQFAGEAVHDCDRLARLVRQSRAIHPDWDAATHLAWLADEGYDGTAAVWFHTWGHKYQSVTETVESWIDRGLLR